MKRICLSLFLCVSTLLAAHAQANDTLYVLCLGNSFTYFHDTPHQLEQIAASQGHCLIIRSETVGGYSFYRHLQDLKSISAIEARAYDYVFLQDQSQAAARYADNKKRFRLIMDDARNLVNRVRMYSPDGQIILERTWAYSGSAYGGFGDMDHFDALIAKGAKQIATNTHTSLSPIGEAFTLCRTEHPEIMLYDPDEKHPSAYGAYLKSCVNYQIIYHTPFTAAAATCGLDDTVCAYLRSIAERVTTR